MFTRTYLTGHTWWNQFDQISYLQLILMIYFLPVLLGWSRCGGIKFSIIFFHFKQICVKQTTTISIDDLCTEMLKFTYLSVIFTQLLQLLLIGKYQFNVLVFNGQNQLILTQMCQECYNDITNNKTKD